MKPVSQISTSEQKDKTAHEFHNDVGDTFLISSECILATNSLLTIGKSYILAGYPLLAKTELKPVVLVSVLYHDGIVNLILKDMLSSFTYMCTICLHCPDSPCETMIVDLDYFLDKMNK